jgi:hypothetical protein
MHFAIMDCRWRLMCFLGVGLWCSRNVFFLDDCEILKRSNEKSNKLSSRTTSDIAVWTQAGTELVAGECCSVHSHVRGQTVQLCNTCKLPPSRKKGRRGRKITTKDEPWRETHGNTTGEELSWISNASTAICLMPICINKSTNRRSGGKA